MNKYIAEPAVTLLDSLRQRGAATECETMLLSNIDSETPFVLHYTSVPAGQLTDIYTVRRDTEALRRAETGDASWFEMERLVHTLASIEGERQITMILMESTERIYVLFCSAQEILSVICSDR